MLKMIAFAALDRLLAGLIGGNFLALIGQAVGAAFAAQGSGEERLAIAKGYIGQAIAEGRVAVGNVATWAINLAIEAAVARVKLKGASPSP